MTIIRINSCRRCKHGAMVPELECRRYPPQISAVAVTMVPPGHTKPETMIQTIAAFPRVEPDSYCGEFAPALAVANDVVMSADNTASVPPPFRLAH